MLICFLSGVKSFDSISSFHPHIFRITHRSRAYTRDECKNTVCLKNGLYVAPWSKSTRDTKQKCIFVEFEKEDIQCKTKSFVVCTPSPKDTNFGKKKKSTQIKSRRRMVREEEKEEIQVTSVRPMTCADEILSPKNAVHNGVTRKNNIYCPHIPVNRATRNSFPLTHDAHPRPTL